MAKVKAYKVPRPEQRDEFDEIRVLLQYVDRDRETFHGPNAQFAANSTVNGRLDQFSQVSSIIRTVATSGGNLSIPPQLQGALNHIEEAYRRRLEVRVVPSGNGSQTAISNYPMVSAEQRTECVTLLGDGSLIVARDQTAAFNLMALFVGALLSRFVRSGPDTQAPNPAEVGAAVWGAFAKIEAYRAALIWKKELVDETRDVVGEIEIAKKEADNTREAANLMVQQHDQLNERLVAMVTQSGNLESEIKATREAVEKAKLDGTAQFIDWAKAAEERLGFVRTGMLWDGRAKAAKLAWLLSFWVVLALLVILPVVAFFMKDTILEFLRAVDVPIVAVGTGVEASLSQYMSETLAIVSRLLLVTAPLAFLIWAIRFLIRFNMRSQLLMDDAEQRKTILETYFLMVERGLVEPKTDRAVLLEALFRALPGHGGDAPEPMNFSDILKLGTDPKKVGN